MEVFHPSIEYLKESKFTYKKAIIIILTNYPSITVGKLEKLMREQGYTNHEKFHNALKALIKVGKIKVIKTDRDKREKILILTKDKPTPHQSVSYVWKEKVVTFTPIGTYVGSVSCIHVYKNADYSDHSTTFNNPHPSQRKEWLLHLDIDNIDLKANQIQMILDTKNYKVFTIPLSKGSHLCTKVVRRPFELDETTTTNLKIPRLSLTIFVEGFKIFKAKIYRNEKYITSIKNEKKIRFTFKNFKPQETIYIKISKIIRNIINPS